MENKNQPAFGLVDNRSSSYEDNEVHYGLTKREYFAGLAMQGVLSAIGSFEYRGSKQIPPEEIVRISIVTADELLKQLEL